MIISLPNLERVARWLQSGRQIARRICFMRRISFKKKKRRKKVKGSGDR